MSFKIKKQQLAPAKTIEITPDDFQSGAGGAGGAGVNEINLTR